MTDLHSWKLDPAGTTQTCRRCSVVRVWSQNAPKGWTYTHPDGRTAFVPIGGGAVRCHPLDAKAVAS